MLKPMSIVDSQSGQKLTDYNKPFILVLQKGENLFESILRCADAANIQSAILQGLGALDDVTVAYYDLDSKSYHSKTFTGMYELISLNGNLSMAEGKRFIHIHAALGREDFSVIGGHIMDATVGPSVELAITPLDSAIYREYNEEIGLKLMCPLKNRR